MKMIFFFFFLILSRSFKTVFGLKKINSSYFLYSDMKIEETYQWKSIKHHKPSQASH